MPPGPCRTRAPGGLPHCPAQLQSEPRRARARTRGAAQAVTREEAGLNPPGPGVARPVPLAGPSAWSVASPRGGAGAEWWWEASTEQERAELGAALDLALELARGIELAHAARLPSSPRRPGTPRAPLTPRCAPPSAPT